MTAVQDVSWDASAPGAYTRLLRFGEWISAPVTPLFETWLLTAMEDRFHLRLFELIGQRAPRPLHVVVNGWYFYSINWMTPGAFARNLPGLLSHLARHPRRLAGILPPTVRHAIAPLEREWRTEVQPRYRAAVDDAERRVDELAVIDLPAFVDDLAGHAGDYFLSMAALGGAAYKTEINLARFYGRHLAPTLGGSHLTLLSGLEAPMAPARHAVASLDWWYPHPEPRPMADPIPGAQPASDHPRLVEARLQAEAAACAALAMSPRRLRAFQRALADAQHVAPIREEQARELTLGWPVMRRAVERIGQRLVGRGVIDDPDDVYFLTRSEVVEALTGTPANRASDVVARRATWARQSKLTPPSFVGRVHPFVRTLFDRLSRTIGAVRSEGALVSGTPASPGRATGAVRVVRGPESFGELQSGEVLVAPMTAPAWTPLFELAAAVVTDVGSVAAHASIIAREYGIPAVVGCGDATSRLRDGMLVTVDGTRGNVEPA